jgi:hypothetical protein
MNQSIHDADKHKTRISIKGTPQLLLSMNRSIHDADKHKQADKQKRNTI